MLYLSSTIRWRSSSAATITAFRPPLLSLSLIPVPNPNTDPDPVPDLIPVDDDDDDDVDVDAIAGPDCLWNDMKERKDCYRCESEWVFERVADEVRETENKV